jgi:hypothetical protein
MDIDKEPPQDPPSEIKLTAYFQSIALRMALHCVRNTIIENYHTTGKLTDSEMAVFNREVANKIYSFLQIVLNPRYSGDLQYALEWLDRPEWDEPVFDKSFLFLLGKINKGRVPRRKPRKE